MAKIKDSQGFLPSNRVLMVPETTPLKDALPQLSGTISGFVLKSPEKADSYRGYIPGAQLFNLVKSGKWKELHEESLLRLSENPQVEVNMIPLAKDTLITNDERNPLETGSTITRVLEPTQEIAGYFVKDKTMEILTSPRVLYCTNPHVRHPNTFPGWCLSCPFPVAE